MTWPPVRELVEKIDDLGYGVPDYERLQDITDKPFQFRNKHVASPHIAFNLSADGSGSVLSSMLSSGPDGLSVFELPHPNLHLMSGDTNSSRLFFVTIPDSCLCSSIFRVIYGSSAGFTLEEVTSAVCCPSGWVPASGDTVPGAECLFYDVAVVSAMLGQNPSGSLTLLGERACEADGEPLACEADGETLACEDDGEPLNSYLNYYRFSSTAPDGRLVCITRKLTGFFSWEAKEDDMTQIWDKITEILDCKNNGGAKPDFWKTSSSEYLPGGCSPTIEELINSMKDHDAPAPLDSNPGCMREAPGTLPWTDVTCGGEECGSGKRQFYCETLKQLDNILVAMEDGLEDYDSGQTGCCCSVNIEYETQWASVENCGCPGGANQICAEVVTEYGWSKNIIEDGIIIGTQSGYCTTDCTVVGNPGEASILLRTQDSDSMCQTPSGGDCDSIPEGVDATWIVGLSSSGCIETENCNTRSSTAQSAVTEGNLSLLSCGYATGGYYRLRVEPPASVSVDCSGAPSFVIEYEMVKMFDAEERSRETGLSESVSWSASEEAFVSEFVAFPSDLEGGMDYDYYNSAWWSFDFVNIGSETKGVGCPRCFYP